MKKIALALLLIASCSFAENCDKYLKDMQVSIENIRNFEFADKYIIELEMEELGKAIDKHKKCYKKKNKVSVLEQKRKWEERLNRG